MQILIADDHSVVRAGLRYVVENLADEITIIEAADYPQVKQYANAHYSLDLLLLDLAMPGIANLNVITELRHIIPATPIVIFSASEDSDTIVEAIRKGAQGFIPKSSHRDVVVAAISKVLAGYLYLPTDLLEKSNDLSISGKEWNYRDPAKRRFSLEKPVMTQRQREVLMLICQGVSNTKIATGLNLSLATVKTHIVNIFKTLGVSNRSQAAYKARTIGLIRDKNFTDSR